MSHLQNIGVDIATSESKHDDKGHEGSAVTRKRVQVILPMEDIPNPSTRRLIRVRPSSPPPLPNHNRCCNCIKRLSPSWRRKVFCALVLIILLLTGVLTLGLTFGIRDKEGQSPVMETSSSQPQPEYRGQGHDLEINVPNGPQLDYGGPPSLEVPAVVGLDNDEVPTCITNECLEAVDRVRSSMNESVDPCQDFYQYACGGWIRDESTKLREIGGNATSTQELWALDKANVERITKLIDSIDLDPRYPVDSKNIEYKIKLFYNSCMDEENLSTIWERLEEPDYSYLSPRLEPALVKAILEEIRTWDDIIQTDNKSTICTRIAQDYIPEGIAKLFVTSHYLDDPARDKGLKELINKLRKTFLRMIPDLSWITDPVSKQNISQSIAGLTLVSGYLDDILNDTFVQDLYANVAISDDFLSNLRSLKAIKERKKKGGSNLHEIHELTSRANSYYLPILETLFIPAGIAQIPIFSYSFPEVLKFAKLGTTVAHEFAHLLNAQIDNFSRNCLVKQYNEVEVPMPLKGRNITTLPLRVNGIQTVNENFADILGIQIAFESFMENAGASFQPIPGLSEKFSKEQIFFIASAQGLCHAYRDAETEVKLLREQVATDVHSPSSVRVLGSLRNYDEFSKAFDCSQGSKYNPEKKCALFSS